MNESTQSDQCSICFFPPNDKRSRCCTFKTAKTTDWRSSEFGCRLYMRSQGGRRQGAQSAAAQSTRSKAETVSATQHCNSQWINIFLMKAVCLAQTSNPSDNKNADWSKAEEKKKNVSERLRHFHPPAGWIWYWSETYSLFSLAAAPPWIYGFISFVFWRCGGDNFFPFALIKMRKSEKQ